MKVIIENGRVVYDEPTVIWLNLGETAFESGPHIWPVAPFDRHGVNVPEGQEVTEAHIRAAHGRPAPAAPGYDQDVQYLGVIALEEPGGELVIPVFSYTAEEIAQRLTESQTALAEQVHLSSKTYIDSRLDPDGMILVNNLYMAGAPKGIAVFNWGVQIRKESYRRQALIKADQSMIDEQGEAIDPIDFSMFGDKPYTIVELMIEAGI